MINRREILTNEIYGITVKRRRVLICCVISKQKELTSTKKQLLSYLVELTQRKARAISQMAAASSSRVQLAPHLPVTRLTAR